MILASLSPRIPTGTELAAILVVVSFSAGLNVYATVGMLGLLARFNVLALPTALHLLQDWKIIAVCAVLFVLEFVGDKIPVFDLLWNAAHTFVRVPVAAYLAYAATSQLPQWEQIAATFRGRIDCSRGAWWEDGRARSHHTFARALLEFRVKYSRRRAGGSSDVDRHAASIRGLRDRSASVLRNCDPDSIRARALRTLLSDAEATLSGTSSGNSLH